MGNTTILYIVLCGNLPYMLYNMPPQTVGEFSFTSIAVDSALTDIYDIVASAGSMFATNPAYLSAASSTNTYPAYSSFASYRDRGGKRVYCVGRIDAHSTAAAKALVDKAIAAENAGGLSGTGYFDGRFGDITGLSDADAEAGDWDIYRAKGFWDAAGLATSYDTNDAVYGFAPAPTTAANAAFHWGWYVGRYDDFASVYSSVPNGAIGVQIHSSAGNNWRDSNPAGQYWMGQAIAAGFTIVHGPVGEPFLEGFANADTTVKFLLPPNRAYVGDALLRSQSGLKWQMFTVGDPLYRPFPS